jgi:hypothetical protein
MTDLRKAAEMALEALMQTEDVMVEVEPNVWEYKSIVAINALRQALAELEAPTHRTGNGEKERVKKAVRKAWLGY